MKHAFRALHHRNFRLFFIGQIISWIGTWMQQLAIGWLAYRLTHSAFLLGLVTFAAQAPTFFLCPFTGAVVDRFNRHKIVITTQSLCMVQALALAALTLSHSIQIWHLIAFGIFIGIVNSVDMPARQSFMVQMVDDKDDLPNAIALNSSLVNAARLIGPTVAGFLISFVGEGTCFLINGLTYLAVIAALFLMNVTPLSLEQRRETDVLSHLKEGWTYAFGFAPIRALIMLLGATSLFGTSFTVLMPVFAKDVYHGTADTLGLLMASSGCGALAGALFLAARKKIPGLGKVTMIATIIFGVGLIIFGLVPKAWMAYLVLPFVGFGMMLQLAGCNTILQTITDEDKRGRVMSLYTMAFMIAPFGGLLSGALAGKIGAGYTVAIGGLLTLIAGLLFGKKLSELREQVWPIYNEKGISTS